MFGICGHGNVGMLDVLYGMRDRITLVSPRHEQTAGHMADAYFRVKHRPAATLTSCGPGSANLVMALANAYADSSALLGADRQRADAAVQPRPVPGTVPAEGGRLPLGLPPRRETQLPADTGGDAALHAAACHGHHAGRPAGAGAGRYSVQPVPGGGRSGGRGQQLRPHRAPWRRRARRRGRGRVAPARRPPPGAVRRPWRDARRGRGRAGGAGGADGGAGDRLAERHGLHADGPSALARLHRPQRRVRRQPGRPPRRPRAGDRRAVRRPLGVLLARRLFLELPRLRSSCRWTWT